MRYHICTEAVDAGALDFEPTLIVAFYIADEEENFGRQYFRISETFPDADIIGCSSESNLYPELPYIDLGEESRPVFLYLEMPPEAYRLRRIPFGETARLEAQLDAVGDMGAIVLGSNSEGPIETLLEELKKQIDPSAIFGAIAGRKDIAASEPATTVFINGTFYPDSWLIWLIDLERYSLKGQSLHDFQPIGFELEITAVENNVIYEIDDRPALEVVEEIIGELTPENIRAFAHPFSICRHDSPRSCHHDYKALQLVSLIDIDRKNKSLELYRDVYRGDRLKIAIAKDDYHQKESYDNLIEHLACDTCDCLLFLFVCIGVKAYWEEMEVTHIQMISHQLGMTPFGFHTFGEIGNLEKEGEILLQNQTYTAVTLCERRS